MTTHMAPTPHTTPSSTPYLAFLSERVPFVGGFPNRLIFNAPHKPDQSVL